MTQVYQTPNIIVIRTERAAPGPEIRRRLHRQERRAWRQWLPRWSKLEMPDAMEVRAGMRKWR